MIETSDDATLVRRYRKAFATFDPDAYGPMLAEDPVYHFGMTGHRGADAYHQNTASGRVLYPFGSLRSTERRFLAEGGWVAVLVEREAITNALAHYENTYTMFYEVVDGRIATQVEMLDGGVAGSKFDLSALDPNHFTPGVIAPPARRADLPGERDESDSACAKRTVLAFLDAFLSFDPDAFEPMLLDDPLHQFGVTRRTGRDAFREIARVGRILYPEGIANRTHHVLVSDGRTVATLLSMRAKTNKEIDYENLYGMFFDVHDGRIASLVEVLDGSVADASFDLSEIE